ncbi:SRPBCC family protein, partial [Acinetobacter baumannii]
ADMTVGYKVFRETFTSRVTLLPAEKRIQVHYLDGPFEHLDNRWTFTDNPDGTSSVGFYID